MSRSEAWANSSRLLEAIWLERTTPQPGSPTAMAVANPSAATRLPVQPVKSSGGLAPMPETW
jgi:hypothetical protein